MNIFVVDKNPVKAACQLHNKHVVKMILESMQMLGNALGDRYGNGLTPLFTKRFDASGYHWAWILSESFPFLLLAQRVNGRSFGFDFLGRKQFSTRGYASHPCTIWVRANNANLHWLCIHTLALCQEYRRRYGKDHSLYREALYIYKLCEACGFWSLPKDRWRSVTSFARAMPEELKFNKTVDDVTAYRQYLSKHKPWYTRGWTKVDPPEWVVSN